MVKGGTVRTGDGTRLHVVARGPVDAGLSVVLAHGFAASMAEYVHQVPALSRAHRVIAYDQRGHGCSERGDLRSMTLDRLGEDLADVIDQTTHDLPVVLVGHSMGGMAVLALARHRPELFGTKVVGVALVSTSARPLTWLPLPEWALETRALEAVRRGYRAAVAASAAALDRLHPFRLTTIWSAVRRRLFARGEQRPDPCTRMRDTFEDTPTSVELALYPACVSRDQTDTLTTIARVPSLVLCGAHDTTISPVHSTRLARALGTSVVHVRGAGHMVDLTHPDPVDRALDDLVGRVLQKENEHT